MTIKFKNVVMMPMEHQGEDALQGWTRLDNGLEISIVKHHHSYGGEKGFYEMGVFQANGGLLQIEEWGDSVKGWLTPKGIDVELSKLQKLA
tara:strand:- start:945 stop:1217 length:273 start_codon:yes stop_codon:yes gene_type:complete